MNTLLVIALIVFMLLTVAMLVRGIIILLKTKEAELMGTGGPSASGMAQNKAMRGRIFFQALAIVTVVLILLLRR